MNTTAADQPALLVLDGELPEPQVVATVRNHSTVIVAADGAARRLLALGVIPDVVIGDLDSLGAERSDLEGAGAEIICEGSQERNDFEKSLQWLLASGVRSIDILGIGGGQTDHVLNNFSIAARFASLAQLCAIERNCRIHFVVDSFHATVAQHSRISLIPLPDVRLTTSGLQWELHDEPLRLGVREGASNAARRPELSIVVHSGAVAVFVFDQNAG